LTLSVLIIVKLRQIERETAVITGKVRRDKSNLVSLLMVSLLYIVSTAPHVAVWGYFDYFDQYIGDFLWHTQQEVTSIYMVGLFTTSISMANYSFNFLIYSCTLKIDRDELRLMVGAC
jgi:predicted membrane-bound dolichyl-phosphate-mannose-protein mannosyltransferase